MVKRNKGKIISVRTNINAIMAEKNKTTPAIHPWTQKRLSRETGISQSALSKLISGDTEGINFQKLVAICNALEIDVSEFFVAVRE